MNEYKETARADVHSEPQQGGGPGDYDPNYKRERIGNNKKFDSRAHKNRRAKLARQSKKRNRHQKL